MLADPSGRRIGYLRLSLTEACQMRCLYCRPEKHGHPAGKPTLSADEYGFIAGHLAAHHGLRKVRLTGGDPSMRPDLADIVAAVAAPAGIGEVAMTTNGLTLARDAGRLRRAGLARVNLSLDSLDGERFAALTGVKALGRVLDGLDAALAEGLAPKLNCVVVRGFNDAELPDLVRFALAKGVVLRFIELMPMGPLAGRWAGRFVAADEMIETLHAAGLVLGEALPQGHDAARVHPVLTPEGARGRVGFITPMSCNFCAACDRLRLGSGGEIYPCLMDRPRGSLLPALRPAFGPAPDAERFDAALRAAYADKAPVHPHDGVGVMTAIGG